MATRKKPPFNQNAAIRAALRRLFAKSPAVRACMHKVRREVPKYNADGRLAKRPAVQYLCTLCKKWVGSTKVSVDHKDPVVALDGFVDWNQFIDRLFCSEANLQVVCEKCHQDKTNAERIHRTSIKYMLELDILERKFVSGTSKACLKSLSKADHKTLLKDLGRYTSKKKTKGLEKVAGRAETLKALLLTVQPHA